MFMSIAKAAKTLGLSVYELRRGINAGEYPALPVGTGRRRVADPEQIKPLLLEKATRKAGWANGRK